MEARSWRPKQLAWTLPAFPRTPGRRWLPVLLISLAALLLGTAAITSAYAMLHGWLLGQDRYLVAEGFGFPSLRNAALHPAPVAALQPTGALPGQPASNLTSQAGSVPAPGSAQAERSAAAVESEAASVAQSATPAGSVAETQPGSASSSQPGAASPDPLLAPVQIRIPALGINRGIIELPAAPHPRTGILTRDVSLLFRRGRKDLVGHWGGSAYPGQPGNTILVGHNYGYGVTGVFLRLGRLRSGQQVLVMNQAGETFTYRVATVKRVSWRRKNAQELVEHTSFLTPGGPERLTLVTCGGANRQPFPERIYVVAEPIH